MIFKEVIKTKTMIKIDGYSKAKTVKGAIKDLAREVAKYSTNEANGLTDYIEDTIGLLNQRFEGCNFWVDCEEVSCASKLDEHTGEIKYTEGNFYIGIGFEK